MYNPYIIPPPSPQPQEVPSPPPSAPPPKEDSALSRWLDMIFKGKFDGGDLLLVLIILFLALDGEEYELMITLGLLLFLGLDD